METKNSNQKYSEELEIDLGDYLRVIWRRKKPVSAIFVFIIIVVILLTIFMPKTYQASNLIRVAKIDKQVIEPLDTTIKIFSNQPNVKIEKVGSDLLEIKGLGKNPEEAKVNSDQAAKKIINYYQSLINQVQQTKNSEIVILQRRIADIDKEIKDLERKTKYTRGISDAQARIISAYISVLNDKKYQRNELELQLTEKQNQINTQMESAKVIVASVLPENPIKPNKKVNIAIGVVLALFISIFYAFVAEYFEKTEKSFSE
ncbi:hypothetical protein J7K86_02905 [bacterium]|nr:hypothetical protein [bacterium]